jgi:glutamyl-tRNA synthetase
MSNDKQVRTRFAPSPTGFLHVGGVRTALFAWLLARQANGQFILRIEDTDRNRHIEESEAHILESLEWLGLRWDEGPFRQSERLETYKEWGQKLVDNGRAYADTRSPEELETVRRDAAAKKKPVLFREYRPENPIKWQPGIPLRFKSEPKKYEWHDEVMGKLSTGPEVVDDFILLKSDGYPTYNFAHIIDDHLMNISHVIRSQEFLPSVPKFLNLYEALDIKPPLMATLPFVMALEGNKKLSKRDGAKDVLDYRKLGFLPEALINFLASLGWNDGTEQELFSLDELISRFSLDRVQKSGARFDEKRLLWINGHYIRELDHSRLSKLAEDFWPDIADSASLEYKNSVLNILQERLKHLSEIPSLSSFFFEEPKAGDVEKLYKDPVDKQLKSLPFEELSQLIKAAQGALDKSDFSRDDIAKRLNDLLQELNSKPGILFASIRIAVTGSVSSPELFGTISVLGREKVVKRLSGALKILEN